MNFNLNLDTQVAASESAAAALSGLATESDTMQTTIKRLICAHSMVFAASILLACATGPKNKDPSITKAREKTVDAEGTDSLAVPTLAGVGSRRLTDTLATTYFIRSADPAGDYVMEVVVFLKGESDWTSQRTDWSFDVGGRIAFSDYKFVNGPFRAELDRLTGVVSILDYKAPTSKANVFVVEGIGGPNLKVMYSELQDLRAPFNADPMQVFVSHSVGLQKALGLGVAPSDPSLNHPP